MTTPYKQLWAYARTENARMKHTVNKLERHCYVHVSLFTCLFRTRTMEQNLPINCNLSSPESFPADLLLSVEMNSSSENRRLLNFKAITL